MERERSIDATTAEVQADRRGFLGTMSTVAMATGLVASYGTLAVMAGRFLYPARASRKGWMFVVRADALKSGESLVYRTPTGATVVIARQGDSGQVDDFVALSSVCPHLGCQVHWEAHNDRFFCPCHNGVFDPQGNAVSGPPADAGQSLAHYPLSIEEGSLFIEVPLESVRDGVQVAQTSDGADADRPAKSSTAAGGAHREERLA